MSAQNFAFAIGAGATVRLPAGRYFMVRTAASAIDIVTEGSNTGSPVRFLNIGAGTKFGPVEEGKGWRNLLVTSAAAQNLEIVISDDGLFDIANAVSVLGVASVAVQPNTGITASGADVSVTTGNASSIAANLSRKAITIGALSTNTGSIRVQSAGAGANRGIELQAGQSVTLTNTAAIDVRNDSGASQSYYAFEET